MKDEFKGQFQESYNDVISKLDGWVDAFLVNLPNMLIAVVVFAIAYFLSGFVRKYVEKFLKGKVEQASLRSLIGTVSSVLVIGLGLFLVLSVLNLDTVLKSLLAGAGVAGLAIGLALQSSLSNTFSGVYLSVNDILNIGDWVETNGYSGTVQEVNLRNTVIKEPDNNLVMIPNSLVVENPFKNFGLTDRIRVILKCGVSYDDDLREVQRIAKEAIRDKFPTDESENIEFHWLEFGDSSINFQIRFWVDAKAKLSILEARSEGIMIIKEAFDKHGIDIPFPIRTLYMPEQVNAKVETSEKKVEKPKNGTNGSAKHEPSMNGSH